MQQQRPQRSLTFYRARMFTGFLFAVLGVIIATEVAMRPAPVLNKLSGFLFAVVAIALGGVRIQQYLKARSPKP